MTVQSRRTTAQGSSARAGSQMAIHRAPARKAVWSQSAAPHRYDVRVVGSRSPQWVVRAIERPLLATSHIRRIEASHSGGARRTKHSTNSLVDARSSGYNDRVLRAESQAPTGAPASVHGWIDACSFRRVRGEA